MHLDCDGQRLGGISAHADRAEDGGQHTTKSSTSANVRSAICCGIGNPAVSRGIWRSALCRAGTGPRPQISQRRIPGSNITSVGRTHACVPTGRNNPADLWRSSGAPNKSGYGVALVRCLDSCKMRSSRKISRCRPVEPEGRLRTSSDPLLARALALPQQWLLR